MTSVPALTVLRGANYTRKTKFARICPSRLVPVKLGINNLKFLARINERKEKGEQQMSTIGT